MNDAYDSVVTYIISRLGIFSKAISGISLILFPPRNLKKKQYNSHLFYLFNLLTMKHLEINGFKKIVQLIKAFSLSAQFARAMLKPSTLPNLPLS